MSLIPFAGAVQKFNRQRGGYQIERSLRFNSADSAYLNRTPASAGNRKTWTWSGWVKLGSTSNGYIFGVVDSNDSDTAVIAYTGNQFSFQGYTVNYRDTTALYRDFSAWYHLVVALDTTQATAANRIKMYVNGVEVTSFAENNNPSQNADLGINTATEHSIGRRFPFGGGGVYFNGYLTEVNFIDGSALDPTSFGEFNSETGVWQPKAYTGSYGTNGFYLNFSDNSGVTSTTLGADSSGNGNNWTPNNFSVTAGAGNDSLVDTPTPYGTDTGVGGEVRGNYATLNPLDNNSLISISNGNLQSTTSSTDWPSVFGSIAVTEGKYYFEITPTTLTTTCSIGVYVGGNRVFPPVSGAATFGYPYDANTYMLHQNGLIYHNGNTYAYQSSYTVGDVLGVVVDATARKVWISKNGVFPAGNDPAAGTGGLQAVSGVGAMPSGPIFPAISLREAAAAANFGARPFAYTAPSGFKALCTQNLPEPTIVDGGEYFNTVLYTGNGSTQSITGVGFQPDWVWLKTRSATGNHAVWDAVRGVSARLRPSSTSAEDTNAITSFDSDGFTLGTEQNASATTYVAWNWKANGAGVTNNDGTITSTVSANPDSGFSIVTYTGNGTAGATVGHGLGVKPSMMIVKKRSANPSVEPWAVYHTSLGATKGIYLNSDGTPFTLDIYWNDTEPTSSVFSIGDWDGINTSGQPYVAYIFAAIPGYSAFGSYTGNGSTDGSFVYLGFRPAFILIKRSSGTENWELHDSVRGSYNSYTPVLYANDTNAEAIPSPARFDILSNGFKTRTTNNGVNGSGSTYIYAAFSEVAFKNSLAR
jgi:hypothetical protein